MIRLALVAALVACGSSTPPPAPLAGTTAERPDPRFTDPLALVPANSDIVMRIDVAAARKTPLWARYGDRLLATLAPALATCPEAPLKDLATISVGLVLTDANGLFVIRGIDRDRLHACLRRPSDTKTTATFERDHVVLTNASGNQNLITFVDRTTMVMHGSKGATAEGLRRGLTMGAPLRKDPSYQALESRMSPGGVFSMIMPGSSQVMAKFATQIGERIAGMVATVHLTTTVAFHVRVITENPAAAARVLKFLEPAIASARQSYDTVDVRIEGTDVVMEAGFSEAQLDMIIELVRQQLPS